MLSQPHDIEILPEETILVLSGAHAPNSSSATLDNDFQYTFRISRVECQISLELPDPRNQHILQIARMCIIARSQLY
jgi:hypothetical protein